MDKNIQKFNMLLKKTAKGDKVALETIYSDYGGLFFAMAKKYLYNKNLAEDLISEVFLRIVKYAKSFDENQNGLNWVFKIIHNCAIDMNKFENKLKCDNIEDHFELYSTVGDPSIALQDDSLSFALKQLDEDENKIIYLIFWESLTIREIAQLMNLPKSNIHYKHKVALKKMRIILNELDKYDN